MAGAVPHERLRNYLLELPPKARELLLAELERTRARGESVPGGDLILGVLLPETELVPRPQRENYPARLFFRPLEPYLCDSNSGNRRPGRIDRAALNPLWQWIRRDLEPGVTQAFERVVASASASADDGQLARQTRDFQDQVAASLEALLSAVAGDERARRRMSVQVGLPDPLHELRLVHTVLANRDTLAVLAQRLPPTIRTFESEELARAHAALRMAIAGNPNLLTIALATVAGRLTASWQLLRLAIASSEHPTKVAQSALAPAVSFVLTDLASTADELRSALKAGRYGHATLHLKTLHDAVRGLRTELDLSRAPAWARELAALRGEVSDILQTEIETVPGRVRRLLRLRKASETRPDSVLDGDEVKETQSLISFVGVCRNCASELAINHPATHAYSALKSTIDADIPRLVEAFRCAGPSERRFLRSQVDAAIVFAKLLFGLEYAAAVSKAAELPSHRKNDTSARAS